MSFERRSVGLVGPKKETWMTPLGSDSHYAFEVQVKIMKNVELETLWCLCCFH